MLYLTLEEVQKDTMYHILYCNYFSRNRVIHNVNMSHSPIILYHSYLVLNNHWQSTDYDSKTNLEVSKFFTTSCFSLFPSFSLLHLWTLILFFSPRHHLPKLCPFLPLSLTGGKLP